MSPKKQSDPSKEYWPAVKAFIVDNNRILIIKRTMNDVDKPGVWEMPGGRLEPNENPIKGLIREVKEEVNLDIEVIKLFSVRRFTRDDKQKIEMSIYLCKSKNKDVKLSEEHSNFEWIDIEKAKTKLTDFFHKEVDIYLNQINQK
jgi:8-oxo-dGTP diphosphatase